MGRSRTNVHVGEEGTELVDVRLETKELDRPRIQSLHLHGHPTRTATHSRGKMGRREVVETGNHFTVQWPRDKDPGTCLCAAVNNCLGAMIAMIVRGRMGMGEERGAHWGKCDVDVFSLSLGAKVDCRERLPGETRRSVENERFQAHR